MMMVTYCKASEIRCPTPQCGYEYIDSSGKYYTKLFSRSELNSWISTYEARGRKPGTIKTNLNSVKKFYHFVLIMEPTYIKVQISTLFPRKQAHTSYKPMCL